MVSKRYHHIGLCLATEGKSGSMCAEGNCKQPPDGVCKRCGYQLCYDHLCSHDSRKRDDGPRND